MYRYVTFYRVVCFKEARGPWRLDRKQAERDAVDEKLGSYDEYGGFWSTVPGDIEALLMPVALLQAAVEKATCFDRAA